jgi:hypothetical protein
MESLTEVGTTIDHVRKSPSLNMGCCLNVDQSLVGFWQVSGISSMILPLPGLVTDTKNGWENHHAIHGKINYVDWAILRDFMGFYGGLMGFYGGLMGKSTMSTVPFLIAMQQITRG